MASRDLVLPDLGKEPIQPGTEFQFPQRAFGKTTIKYRSCQPSWFGKWKWLHYDVAEDVVFCHTCVQASKKGCEWLSTGNVKDSTFVYGGFSNWKDATSSFPAHEQSQVHKKAVEAIVKRQDYGDVGNLLSSKHEEETRKNRQCLMKIGENIRFLARQGLALRGDGDEHDSNFIQLLHLRAIDYPGLLTWMEKKIEKYTSPEIQNELIQVMAHTVLRGIATDIRSATFFTLMADEVTDVSNKEQVAVCLRCVDDDFEVHEFFVGMYEVESIKADILVTYLKDVPVRLSLPVHNCRGQCYDGAANMAGSRHGVATQFLKEEPRATFTHCYGHALNLAAGDALKSNKILRDTLDTTFEISKLIKFSPRRGAMFAKLKEELAPACPSFRTLCPTRWTVRGRSLQSVIDNYRVFQELWDDTLEVATDFDTKSRLGGAKAAMNTFNFLFGLVLGERLLKHTDSLSQTLQDPDLAACEAQATAELTCETLSRTRTDEAFDLFWEKTLQLQQELGVPPPELPRKRRAPPRLEVGSSSPHFPSTPKELYRPIYFECLDHIISSIRSRFDQPGYATLVRLENVPTRAAKGEEYSDDLAFILKHYGG